MSKIYGVVLVGCGHIGASHLDDLYFRENIKIIGVVDTNIEKAKEFAKKYNAESYGADYHVYLEDDKVDIVIISTYTATHLQILADCLKQNKNVLCEKPISNNLSDGQVFFELVKSSSTKVLVGHILRHNETYQHVANMIHNGAIGNMKVMRMVQNHHAMDWERYRRLLEDCSPIIDCGVHYFDVMQWFTGAKIINVNGIHTSTERDVPAHSYNYGLITVELTDGSVGYYEAGWGNTFSSQNTKEFIGDIGRIKITLQGDRFSNREEGDLIELYNFDTNNYQIINLKAKYKNTYNQIMCLIDMIENATEGTPTIEEVYNAFKVAIAADEVVRKNTNGWHSVN